MKVWELKEGKEYTCDSNVSFFKIIGGRLHYKIPNAYNYIISDNSYNKVIEFNFTEYTPPTDWSKVKVDAKMLVKGWGDRVWKPRHFAKFEDGKVYTWMDGETSWTSDDDENITIWTHYKLAEESEE